MTAWTAMLAEARENRTLLAIGLVLIASLLVRIATPDESDRLHTAFFCLGLHLLLLPAAGVTRALGLTAYGGVRLALVIFEALAVISASSLVLFAVFLPRCGVRSPRILRDVLVTGAMLLTIFLVASRAGFNLSGLIATSAVVTAVIGLSFQDTLGNVMAGLALHMDRSVEVGDWVKVTDLSGRVTDVGWRATSVETRNWETMVIPNSILVRNLFLVLGRREGRPVLWRRWVYFNIDFRFHPGDVMDAVTEAVRAAPIEHVATEPPAQCVLMDLHESYGRYAIRYWLTDIAVDDPTDSAVRTRIYFALRRAGIPLSMPAHAVFLTTETTERKVEKSKEEAEHRREALARIDLFDHLSEGDRARLAASLRYAPFAKGEVMTRQGAEGHWLYLILEGEASVRVAVDGHPGREVARLEAGNFFGEMSLMTGAPRSATVVALTSVECFRLDKAAFHEILRERPELADRVAELLAKRRIQLVATKEELDADAVRRRLAAAKHDLLGSIRRFFGLGDDEAAGDEAAASPEPTA